MATFNRAPLSVNTPNSSQAKQYYFNHYNWKGLNDSKNFLAVDQETFSDCNNVYMDANGLLRSRPAMKLKVVTYKNGDNSYELSDILDVWNFGDITVYKTCIENAQYNGVNYKKLYHLTFVDKNAENQLQHPLTYKDNLNNYKSYSEVKLILADKKIFIFSEYAFEYYDVANQYIYTGEIAEELIHVPVTSVIVNDVISSKTEVESPNIMTTSYITKHVYTSLQGRKLEDLIDKNVTVKIGDVDVYTKFIKNKERVFVGKYFSLNKQNISDNLLLGQASQNIPLVEVSETDSTIVSTYSYVLDEHYNPTVDWRIYHTVDGLEFKELEPIDCLICSPKISTDGNYCIVFKSDGPYIISLLNTIGEGENSAPKYPTWVNLLEGKTFTYKNESYDFYVVNEETQKLEPLINFNEKNEEGSNYNNTCAINAHFRDDSVFSFTFGSGLQYLFGDPSYKGFYCIFSDGDNIYIETVFDVEKTYEYEYSIKPGTTSSYGIPLSYNYTNVGNSGTAGIVEKTYSCTPSTKYTFEYGKTYPDGKPDYVISTDEYAKAEITNVSIVKKYVEVRENPSFGYVPVLTDWGWTVQFKADVTITTYELVNNVLITNQIVKKQISKHYDFLKQREQNVPLLPDVIEDANFTFTFNENTGYMYMTAKSIPGKGGDPSTRLDVNGNYVTGSIGNKIPTIHISKIYESGSGKELVIALNFTINAQDGTNIQIFYNILKNNRGIYKRVCSSSNETTYDTQLLSPLKQDLLAREHECMFLMHKFNDYTGKVELHVITYDTLNYKTKTCKLTDFDYSDELRSIFSSGDAANIVTNDNMYAYDVYTDDKKYEPIPLLFTSIPIKYTRFNNDTVGKLYLYEGNYVYRSALNQLVIIDDFHKGSVNYILPKQHSFLSNHYISTSNSLNISAPAIKIDSVSEDGKLTTIVDNNFKWYFPEINTQTFDSKIENLQNISETDVAIFLKDSVNFVTWDGDVKAYRYYASKLQTGCNKDSDVTTTYDGKYVMFPSSRGFVSMSHQEFVTTNEQALSYLSDTIGTIYDSFLLDANDGVKLYKHSYWIMLYKPGKQDVLLFDVRNSSWWKFTFARSITKILTIDDKPCLLCEGKMFTLSTSETDYFDEAKTAIDWHFTSQKLHFSALNYYKNVSNVTLTSLHNKDEIEQVTDGQSYYKLQVLNYRKNITGTSGTDDYTPINYKIDSMKTYVLKLNYSKLNEFQYSLRSDNDSATSIPLSLSSITIKYKIGGQIR